MKRRPPLAREFVGTRELHKLGLRPGYRVGHLDGTINYVTDDRYDRGPYDRLQRELTVVDAYSALVDIEELQRGRINVVIQALGPEELFVQEELQDPSDEPPRGIRSWRPVFTGDELVERIKIGIDEHLRFAKAHEDYIEVALTEPDVRRIVADGKIAMVLMLVSGYIADSLDVLKELRELGIRVMCPSHLAATPWADSSAELNDPPGLTDFGRDVISTCNEIGVLVDLAHCCPTLHLPRHPSGCERAGDRNAYKGQGHHRESARHERRRASGRRRHRRSGLRLSGDSSDCSGASRGPAQARLRPGA